MSETIVTARLYGWAEARANNKLAEPDPAIPVLDVADMVTGPLTKQEESVQFGKTVATYTRYLVNGQDVDPTTIRAVLRKDAMTTASLGNAVTVNTATRARRTRKEKLAIVARVRKQLSETYLDVKYGPVYKAALSANKKYEEQLQRDLKKLYLQVLAKIGPLSHWVDVAHTLQPVQKSWWNRLRKASLSPEQISVRDQLLAEIQQTMGQVEDDPTLASTVDDLNNDSAQAANQAAIISMIALGAGPDSAGLLGSDTGSASDADIVAAYQDQLPTVSQGASDMINGTVDTLLASIASIAAQIDAGEEPTDLNDLIDSKSNSVAGDVFAAILGGTLLQTFKSNGVDEKRWITMEDDLVCEDCLSNSQDGWIGVDDTFTTGDDAPPAHPNCRCTLANRGGNEDDIQPPDEGG